MGYFFQTCLTHFVWLNEKEDILKYGGNLQPLTSRVFICPTVEVSDFQLSSKYHLLVEEKKETQVFGTT